jgi:hypothetical protein
MIWWSGKLLILSPRYISWVIGSIIHPRRQMLLIHVMGHWVRISVFQVCGSMAPCCIRL